MYDIIKFYGASNVAKPAFVAVPTKRLNISVTNIFFFTVDLMCNLRGRSYSSICHPSDVALSVNFFVQFYLTSHNGGNVLHGI